jgi:hypothetical protein
MMHGTMNVKKGGKLVEFEGPCKDLELEVDPI